MYIFIDLFLNYMFFLVQELFFDICKLHNYIYKSYSDTRPVLGSLLTIFSFEPHIPSNWVNSLVLIHFLVTWSTSLSNFFQDRYRVAHFLSHCISERVLLSLLMHVDLAEFRILGSQRLLLKPPNISTLPYSI